MTRVVLFSAAFGVALACAPALAVESWNSACLLPLRQAKEDWTRLATPQARNAVAREITLAEQSYRRGKDQDCKARVERIKAMMK
ncbi:MAG: hypothetical protein ACT4N4_10500 [Rhodospirillales bacterium]